MQLMLGVTRRDDDPKGPLTGVIRRDGEVLRFASLADLGPNPALARLVPDSKRGAAFQQLARIEHTVSGVPRVLFTQPDGKLAHHDVRDLLQFSEANKALLKPQRPSAPLPLGPLVLAYLEVSRLSDAMRKDMMGGERSVGQLAEVLGLPAADKALDEALWNLARQGWLTRHELGKPAENAIALNRALPSPR
jgi:hypothetical protein